MNDVGKYSEVELEKASQVEVPLIIFESNEK